MQALAAMPVPDSQQLGPAPAAPFPALKHRPVTPSWDVCVHCRRSKLGCDTQKPCRRCIRRGRESTCVSWRDASEAAGGHGRGRPARRRDLGEPEAGRKRRKSREQGSASAAPPSALTLLQAAAMDSDDTDVMVSCGAVDDGDGSTGWSEDEDDFSQGLKYLEALPMPDDFVFPASTE